MSVSPFDRLNSEVSLAKGTVKERCNPPQLGCEQRADQKRTPEIAAVRAFYIEMATMTGSSTNTTDRDEDNIARRKGQKKNYFLGCQTVM